MTLEVRSSAFADGVSIPVLHTCEGQDVSPPLAWTAGPEGTKSYVVIIDNPDAPDPRAPKMTWVHWLLYDIPAGVVSLAEGASRTPPVGARGGKNDWKRTGYGGPCPPVGRHRYFHKLYALDTLLGDLHEPDKAALETAMEGHILAQGVLLGTYQKAGR